MALRLIFMGTPDFAVPTLKTLAAQGHDIAAVYTRAAKPAGRGMKLAPTPVARVAEALGAPVLTPASLRDAEEQTRFAGFKADAAVVVAYGLILPQPVLDAPRLGCFNLHASLLPRWRGAAPIQRAIMAGDAETGAMAMKMEAGLDTGPIAMTARVAIDETMTASDLHDRLAARGAALMAEAVGALERGALTLTPQAEHGVTYAAKIDKAEAQIDWTRPAAAVLRQIHGLSPFPGAWSEADLSGETVRLKLLRVTREEGRGAPGTVLDDRLLIACDEGALRVTHLQRAGKAPMTADEFLRGAALPRGVVLR